MTLKVSNEIVAKIEYTTYRITKTIFTTVCNKKA